MRVLMLSWEYPPHIVGGIGTHVTALVPALARLGVHVTLVTPRWGGGDFITRLGNNAVVYRIDMPTGRSGNYFGDAKLANTLLQEAADKLWADDGAGGGPHGFDLIHAHDWLVAFAADALKGLHKTPLVATLHATERGRGRGYLSTELSYAINTTEWWLAYQAWRVITVSRSMAQEVRAYLNLPADKIDVVPNGVDAAPFDALVGEDLSSFRQRWAAPGHPLVFFVGRLHYEKGAQVLIEAVPRVLASAPDARFVIAGMGPMLDSLQRRALELGVSDRVTLAGFVSDDERNRLFHVSDVAVFPSLYEPFGIVALEAMAACCPVVVTDVGGLREVVRHEETGIVVHPDNPDSLAWGVLQVLGGKEKAMERAKRAARMVRSEYSWDRIAERTAEVYDRVVGERGQVVWT
ncbi:MAG: glycosyltransferase family 4 protein [Rudaea sp.]